ncbi:glycerate dehydrogenase [Idiomarina loihiensis]|uniref:D-2-hydroxyacid dehydrogenase n=1 Tax=Idiomarina TaxID=135575 RepID=UPI000D7152F1|nr:MULTISPECIES: D-2-hydroxyacid dehydrogenase [Idiomarina]PWW39455.1 glycerate dehydrogenase [Idiomarina loihiensis]TDP49450.1 glycerate dehydrogenase [Idiomarina loihiensis]TDS24236.1 glycerate dehydrogenase [Idiomarina sp. H2]
MKAVILDAKTLGDGIDLSAIEELVDDLVLYDSTTPEEVGKRIRNAEIVITNKVVINKSTLESAAHLKLICVLATGMNNIDTATAEKLNISVKNVEAYGTASVVQHTLMMMLALATKLPIMQKRVAAGDWQNSSMFCLLEPSTIQLAGKKLVIVGSGELGQAVKTLAEAFGMAVEFSARPGKTDDSRPSLNELLPGADIISFHCPLTDNTKNLLNADNLKRCKQDALVINNARGGVINEQDVADALRAGKIGGVAADVLPQEPPKDGNPLLDAMNEGLNLIVTPHNAWTTPEARQRIVELTAENIKSI